MLLRWVFFICFSTLLGWCYDIVVVSNDELSVADDFIELAVEGGGDSLLLLCDCLLLEELEACRIKRRSRRSHEHAQVEPQILHTRVEEGSARQGFRNLIAACRSRSEERTNKRPRLLLAQENFAGNSPTF